MAASASLEAADASAARAPAQGYLSIVTFNVGAKTDTRFIRGTGVKRPPFVAKMKKAFEILFQAHVVCLQEVSPLWVLEFASWAPNGWQCEVDGEMCCVTMWSPLLQRRARDYISIFPRSTSIYRQWRRAMALVFVHLGSGNKWVVVSNHTISGAKHRQIKGSIENFCESAIQSVLTQTMALASAQGKPVTWVAMGNWNFLRVQGFLTVLRKVPYPAGMEEALSSMQMSGSHRDFMVSNSPMQKQCLENRVEAMDKQHMAVFCNIVPCGPKERLQEPALAPAQSSFADAAQSDAGKKRSSL